MVMKRFIITILCCSIVCSLFANTDYRKAGLGVPRYSNHGFELSVSHSPQESTIEKPIIENNRSTTTSSSNKITKKTASKPVQVVKQEKIKEEKASKIQQHQKVAKPNKKDSDTTNIIITLIIVTGVLLGIAILVFGWYWLVFGMWY